MRTEKEISERIDLEVELFADSQGHTKTQTFAIIGALKWVLGESEEIV